MLKIFGLGCRLVWFPFDTPLEGRMRYALLIYDNEQGWARLGETVRRR